MEGEQSYWAQTHGNCSSSKMKMKPVLDLTEFNLDISAESEGKILQQA